MPVFMGFLVIVGVLTAVGFWTGLVLLIAPLIDLKLVSIFLASFNWNLGLYLLFYRLVECFAHKTIQPLKDETNFILMGLYSTILIVG
jgi:uncharacterized membrane protein